MTDPSAILPPLILVALALLAFPVFALGLCVSLERGRTRRFSGMPDDPDTRLVKLIRAHGNATEYVPTQMVMILTIGLIGVSQVALGVIVLSILLRYVQAAGIIFGGPFHETNAIRFVGSLGTYLMGFMLGGLLVVTAF